MKRLSQAGQCKWQIAATVQYAEVTHVFTLAIKIKLKKWSNINADINVGLLELSM